MGGNGMPKNVIIGKIAKFLNVSIEDIKVKCNTYRYKDNQMFMVKDTGKSQVLYTKFGTNNWIYYGILE